MAAVPDGVEPWVEVGKAIAVAVIQHITGAQQVDDNLLLCGPPTCRCFTGCGCAGTYASASLQH
jgi:hypothetical protein